MSDPWVLLVVRGTRMYIESVDERKVMCPLPKSTSGMKMRVSSRIYDFVLLKGTTEALDLSLLRRSARDDACGVV